MARADIVELRVSGAVVTETEDDLTTQRLFSVLASDPYDAKLKLAAAGVQINSVWSDAYGTAWDSSVVVRSMAYEGKPHAQAVTGREDGDYLVTVEYGRRSGGEAAINGPTIYRSTGSLQNKPVDVDRYGNPIINTAEEPLSPELTKPNADEVLKVDWWTQNTGGVAAVIQMIRPYRGALNSVSWQGADARAVLCLGIENVDEADDNWYKLSARFQYKPPIDVADISASDVYRKTAAGGAFTLKASGEISGWSDLRLNKGLRKINPAAGGASGDDVVDKFVAIVDGEGNKVDEPVLLDKDGAVLTEGANAVVLAFETNEKEQDFNALGI